ncbi:hypothetical protein ODJ79_35005 [Actinoplanes sp. KI2]|uniref:LamG-like jellyroll fold domain-containing protein n=1 Tax=Actinoplanes sp. KI2 TaxID=2983315 RepID=UPI0021D5D332|nr:LamG-like jellyroll fold domain-containing protein [Actinoplanes sp. KI2]MCU7728950.1 hypothetical protein [Actinoplanes sp. KI2]
MSRRSTPTGRLALATTMATLCFASAIGVATPAHAAPVAAKVTPAAKTPPAVAKPTNPTAAAIAKAKQTGAAVGIAAQTTESSTVLANPDGTLTKISSSNPQRVLQNGKWVPIDTTLVRRTDGSYAPRAAVTSVTIGGGGSTRLVSLADSGHSLGFTWPGRLPVPTVSGDTATYANVLSGVDLQITADATGYSSMLVVKTAEAAANPALASLQLGLGGTGVKVRATRDGAEAIDKATGRTVFHSDTALMWDSSPAAGEPAGPSAKAALAGPNAEHAASARVGGHRARVTVSVSGGKQTLTLNRSLLTAKTTKFPVFVDPEWSGSPGRSQLNWARISSNGWNVYNSTSTTGSTSARIGYDNWPTGDAEKARTYYQMNTSGIKGAVIFNAHLYVTERWAASCSDTTAAVYGAGATGFSSSTLYWGHEPGRSSSAVDTAASHEANCSSSTPYVTPAKLDFDVSSWIKNAAGGNWSVANFAVVAANESDKYSWKQLGYGGGATLSVTYSYRPKLKDGTGDPAVHPSVVDQGKIMTTTHTPTLSSRAIDPDLAGGNELVEVEYHVYNSAGTQVAYGYGPKTIYNTNGSDWTTPSLADGTYTWKVNAKNAAGLWMVGFGPNQTFTIDTSAPAPPNITSEQFPPRQVGAAYGDKGTFAINPHDKANNVMGYLFAMDSTLANTTYAANHGTAWTTSTTIKAGTIYYAKADNATGTGTVVINGNAGISFAPGTAGAHTLYVKAVDQAGSTSGQTPYLFYAGAGSPTYAYGDKLISGWTATNTDGTTTVVPAATTTTTGGYLVSQAAIPGLYFGDGWDAVLSNHNTGKVAKGDTATFSFDIPATGNWDIGADLTSGTADGIWDIVLDAGKSTATTVLTNHDGYSAAGTPLSTQYVDFGIIKDAQGKPLALAKGVHTLTFTMVGINPGSAGYQAGIDLIRLAPSVTCTIDDTSKCLNNTAITTYTAGSPATVTTGDADGGGYTINAADLTAAGWTAGRTVTVDGAAVKLPAAFGNGASDNMLGSGQTITFAGGNAVDRGNALVFVGFATQASVKNITGTINYAAGSCLRSQAYTIDNVTDWAQGSAGGTVLTMPRRNWNNATQDTTVHPSLFAMSVPLSCPGDPIASITLPLVSNSAQDKVPSAHFIGLGVRPISATGSDTTAMRWVGSWAAAQDTAAVQAQTSDTSPASTATLNNQTLRIPVHLSLGTGTLTGDQIRIHLSNQLGTTPVTFDAVSVALQDSTAGGANAAATPIALTFAGNATATLPAGTDLLTDPVTLSVPPQGTLLVSLKVHGSLSSMQGHKDSKNAVYASASDNADHTKDQTAANFTKSAMTGLPFLSAVDVSTSTTRPVGALVLYGDQTVNSDTATPDGQSLLSDDIANAFVADPNGDGNVPFGVLNEGSSSWGNAFLLPNVAVDPGANPQSAVDLVDREVLSQADVRTVLISAGTADLLTCTGTAAACAATVQNKLVALAGQLRKYYADDALNLNVNFDNGTGALTVYVATIPPFTGTHTAAQETARENVNAYILGSGQTYLNGNADGVVDFAAAVSTGANDTSDTVKSVDLFTSSGTTYPNDLYYQDLAARYLADAGNIDDSSGDGGSGTVGLDPAGSWSFDDGTGTTAADTGATQTHPATLHNATWGAGRLVGDNAAVFNGTSSYAGTDLTIDTTKSFSVSAWVRLTDKSADRTVFSRDASGNASFSLLYQQSTDQWLAEMPSATSGAATLFVAGSDQTPQVGVWTQLTAVYDADATTLTLYVNGASGGGTADVTPFNDPNGAMWIGRGSSTWFAGAMADVDVWQRALDPAEVVARTAATPVIDWELDEGSATTVNDTSTYNHPGTIAGGATWTAPGHNAIDPAALTLNGTNAAITAAPVLRTDQSFTVTAWARLTSTANTATVLSQDGTHSSGFQLQFAKSCGCWTFVLPQTDTATPAVTTVQGPAATLNAWTHLTAIYDAQHNTATLYVNGTQAASQTVPAATWTATGAFAGGRNRSADTNTNYFTGDIDAIHAYQGILAIDDITNQAAN